MTLFWPVLAFTSSIDKEESVYRTLPHSEIALFCACSIIIVLPLFIDIVLDFVFWRSSSDLRFRILSITSLFVYCGVTIGTVSDEHFGVIQLTVGNWLLFTQICLLLSQIRSLDKKGIWNKTRVGVLVSLYFSVCFLKSIGIVVPELAYNLAFQVVLSICYYSPYLITLLVAVPWFVKVNRELRQVYSPFLKDETLKDHLTPHDNVEDLYCGMLITVALLLVPMYMHWHHIIGAAEHFSDVEAKLAPDTVTGLFVFRSLFAYVNCAIPGRLSKRRAIEWKYDTELKSSFVRFISHELRTPVSVALIGLDLVNTQLELGAELNECGVQSLRDARVSCNDALAILEDLLLYEKLQSRAVITSFVRTRPIVYANSCLQPMVSIAHSSGVSLNILSPERNRTDVLSSLRLYIDKDLVGITMRNLVLFSVHQCKLGAHIHVDMTLIRRRAGSITRTATGSLIGSITGDSVDGNANISSCVSGDVLRIFVCLPRPLSEHEREVLLSPSLQFTRHASGGSGNFALSMWIATNIAALHRGAIGFCSYLEGEALYIDLPCFRIDVNSHHEGGSMLDSLRMVCKEEGPIVNSTSSIGVPASPSNSNPIDFFEAGPLSSEDFKPFSRQVNSDDLAAGILALTPVFGNGNAIHGHSTNDMCHIPRTLTSHSLSRSYSDTTLIGRSMSREAMSRTMILLVVDDSQLIRTMMVRLLTSLGHRVVEAENGKQAVEIIAESMHLRAAFDIVLLDNEMPVLRGRDAVSQMRTMGYAGLVLGVTGNALKDDLDDFVKSGADAVIVKPMTRQKFQEFVSNRADLMPDSGL